MLKPTQPARPPPKPVDDPLAVLIDKLSDEVEPVAGPSADATLTPTPASDIDPAG